MFKILYSRQIVIRSKYNIYQKNCCWHAEPSIANDSNINIPYFERWDLGGTLQTRDYDGSLTPVRTCDVFVHMPILLPSRPEPDQ